MILLTLV